MKKQKILIIGATGMLGNALFSELSRYRDFDVYGTTRGMEGKRYFNDKLVGKIIPFIDIENLDNLIKVFDQVRPDVVVNCVGLIKQLPTASERALALNMNALFPHRLAALSKACKARMIHFSTDCVFSGKKGSSYLESDQSDAEDIYGKTKFLGEVDDENCVTVRTSIIGHGLESHVSLIDWFLTQKGKIRGFTKVIYSGLPTVEHARIIAEYIIPNQKLKGLYHVSADPIAKYDLLKLVSKVYDKKIEIEPFDEVCSDLSLDSSRFRKAVKYTPPAWEKLVKNMYRYYKSMDQFVKFDK